MTDDETYTLVIEAPWQPSDTGYRRELSVEEEFRRFWATSTGPNDTWTLLDPDGRIVAQYPEPDDGERRAVVIRDVSGWSAWCPGCGDRADPAYERAGVNARCENDACPVALFEPWHDYFDADASGGGHE